MKLTLPPLRLTRHVSSGMATPGSSYRTPRRNKMGGKRLLDEKCPCGKPLVQRICTEDGNCNRGRKFIRCSNYNCDEYWLWLDPPVPGQADSRICTSHLCDCGFPSYVQASGTKRNPGRLYYSCYRDYSTDGKSTKGCGYMEWVDEAEPNHAVSGLLERLSNMNL